MVGIHARTGREKISSRYVAHVLNDETQRKYIQVSIYSISSLLPTIVVLQRYHIFSSPEPKAQGELIVWDSNRRLCMFQT